MVVYSATGLGVFCAGVHSLEESEIISCGPTRALSQREAAGYDARVREPQAAAFRGSCSPFGGNRIMSWSVFNDIDTLREMGCATSIIDEATEWDAKWKAFLACPMGPYLAYGDPEALWRRPAGPMGS